MDIKLRILRFNPETDRKGHWEEYNLEADPDERILDLLHKVKWFDDGSLAFRRSCAHGVCGSDAMVVNGENMLACQVLVKEVSNPIKIEPIRGLPVIKDLVVDMETFFESYKKSKVLNWFYIFSICIFLLSQTNPVLQVIHMAFPIYVILGFGIYLKESSNS